MIWTIRPINTSWCRFGPGRRLMSHPSYGTLVNQFISSAFDRDEPDIRGPSTPPARRKSWSLNPSATRVVSWIREALRVEANPLTVRISEGDPHSSTGQTPTLAPPTFYPALDHVGSLMVLPWHVFATTNTVSRFFSQALY